MANIAIAYENWSSASRAENLATEPYAISVVLEIENARVPAFLEAMKIDIAGSRKEEGCLRFDMLRDRSQPNKFVLYEAYKDEAALEFHNGTAHFKAWTDFYAEGGVTSLAALKCDGFNFQV